VVEYWILRIASLASRIKTGPVPVSDNEEAPMPYQEPTSDLSPETRDMHLAIESLKEELEAVDWYHQRVNTCRNPELRALLAHNRDEEKEHASMLLEWIRRKDPTFSKELKDYLFTTKPLVHE
jgi:ferritin-like protein